MCDCDLFTQCLYPGRNSELPDVAGGLKLEPPFPSNVQCYFKLPHFVVLLFDVSIFITLGLAGV